MFAPVIDIDDDLYDKLAKGEVVLSPGQWVKLKWSDRKARWIGVTPRGIFVVQHYEGGYSKEKYRSLLDYFNGCVKEDNNEA